MTTSMTSDSQPCMNKNILVVEDDKLSANLIESYLTKFGYAVTCAADGESAWNILLQDTTRFKCILLDYMLPDIDGMEVLHRIKKAPGLSEIPVIFVTSLNDVETIQNAFAHGAFSYLTKPLDIKLMKSIVHAAIDRCKINFDIAKDRQESERSLELLNSGIFHCRTLDEAQLLAKTLAMACPDSGKVSSGLLELLINGIEHGMLDITYDDKTKLVLSESWKEEVNRRLKLKCYLDKKVTVLFERKFGEIVLTIRDDGPGFDCQCYLEFDPARAMHPHGRGIAMACMFNLDNVEFLGNGNTVRVTISTGHNSPTL
ncbi:response regulator [Solidesulfovibrio magneticus]|nr:response regulator [Solidesulfovibrio magneticus]